MITKFNFNITNSWYVALHHGHSAFRLLEMAYEIENEHDKLKKSLKTFEGVKYGNKEHIHTIINIEHLTKEMFKISAVCIATYQAMMEGLINNAIDNEKALLTVKNNLGPKNWERAPFKDKWEKSLTALNKPINDFGKYNSEFYKKFRIPLIHPTNSNLNNFNKIECSSIKSGFKHGWVAYQNLFDGLGKPHDNNSWETMCNNYNIAP